MRYSAVQPRSSSPFWQTFGPGLLSLSVLVTLVLSILILALGLTGHFDPSSNELDHSKYLDYVTYVALLAEAHTYNCSTAPWQCYYDAIESFFDALALELLDGPWGDPDYPMARYQRALTDREAFSADRPSVEDVSDVMCDLQGAPTPGVSPHDPRGLSTLLAWHGQVLDHTIVLTETDPEDRIQGRARTRFVLGRSGVGRRLSSTEPSTIDRRQQINLLSSHIDASFVYGTDENTTLRLRDLDHPERGHLRLTAPDTRRLLPVDPETDLFEAGDPRAAETLVLTAFHTLWAREHNYWADYYGGDFEMARRIVTYEFQFVTYNEFLPALLGGRLDQECYRWSWPYRQQDFERGDQRRAPGLGRRHDPTLDPRIRNEFATAAYRFGHTTIPDRLEIRGSESAVLSPHAYAADENVSLADVFFAPVSSPRNYIAHGTYPGIEPLLWGAAFQPLEAIDRFIVDGLRRALFGSLDLAALNLFRGRDHGLPSYQSLRSQFQRPPERCQAALADLFGSSPLEDRLSVDNQERLRSVYGNDTYDRGHVDAWIGLISEEPLETASIGPTAALIIADQFWRMRETDPHFYEYEPDLDLLDRHLPVRLADVIARHTAAPDVPASLARQIQGAAHRSPPFRGTVLEGNTHDAQGRQVLADLTRPSIMLLPPSPPPP